MENDLNNYNIYGLFQGEKKKVVDAFSTKGWEPRKSSWTDYELRNDWSEIEISGDEPDCLFNASVNNIDEDIDKIADVFNSIGLTWSLEVYDSEEKLIREIKNT